MKSAQIWCNIQDYIIMRSSRFTHTEQLCEDILKPVKVYLASDHSAVIGEGEKPWRGKIPGWLPSEICIIQISVSQERWWQSGLTLPCFHSSHWQRKRFLLCLSFSPLQPVSHKWGFSLLHSCPLWKTAVVSIRRNWIDWLTDSCSFPFYSLGNLGGRKRKRWNSQPLKTTEYFKG